MIGVTPYEDTVAKGLHGSPRPWSEGTLHHVFPGGQLWVIPFGNHPRATNPLCSVGLSLDPELHPLPDCSAEEEFAAFLEKYPAIAAQFTHAEPVREWERENEPQFSVRQTVGDRWCLAGPAAGFSDDLFSRNLTDGLEVVQSLAWRLIDALAEDDLSAVRFAPVEELSRGLAEFSDTLLAGAYTASRDWNLWNAWSRVWALGQIFATFEIDRSYAKYLDYSRDPAALSRLERQAPSGGLPEHPPLREALREAAGLAGSVREGGIDPQVAAEKIFGLLHQADFVPPAFRLTDPDSRWTGLTPHGVLSTLRWAKTSAPPDIGSLTRQGLRLAMRKRFASSETQRREELKHLLARWPVVGRPFRVPAPE
jgi:FADH2 O2-dependent halogenase